MVLSGITFVAVAALGQTPCKSGCSAGWEFAGPATYVDRGDDLKISNAGAINNVVNSHWDKKNWFGKLEKKGEEENSLFWSLCHMYKQG